MTLHALHLDGAGVAWCIVTLAFLTLSTHALVVFIKGVFNARAIPKSEPFRRTYALDKAWDYVLSEAWRFAQHFASLLLGVTSFFITPIPPHEVPPDAALFGRYVIVTLFFLNVCAGANTIRSLRTWRRREEWVRPIKHWPAVWPPKEERSG